MEDNRIIDLYWQRSEIAILETEKKYGSYCHSISYNILHCNEDVEECINDTYLKAWNSMPTLRPNCLRAFLGKIVRNLSFDKYRMAHAQKRNMGEFNCVLAELEDCIATTSIEQSIEEKLLVEYIDCFLKSQDVEKRIIFIRRYWYVYSISEIAQQIGFSENKVTLILFRMRKELQKYLEAEGIFL